MTRKVFWTDPYLTTLETRVRSVSAADVTVDDTIFYATSGGQESDRGQIGPYPVLQARRVDKDIIYTLALGHTLRSGDRTVMTIDWERRYALMRLHFAAELVLELTCRFLPSVEKIGAHICEDKSRIDFEYHANISHVFPLICEEINGIVDNNVEIVSDFSDIENESRYWEIDGFARVPCGGTHPRRTGEVGPIELKRKNIGKAKERVEIILVRPNLRPTGNESATALEAKS